MFDLLEVENMSSLLSVADVKVLLIVILCPLSVMQILCFEVLFGRLESHSYKVVLCSFSRGNRRRVCRVPTICNQRELKQLSPQCFVVSGLVVTAETQIQYN